MNTNVPVQKPQSSKVEKLITRSRILNKDTNINIYLP